MKEVKNKGKKMKEVNARLWYDNKVLWVKIEDVTRYDIKRISLTREETRKKDNDTKTTRSLGQYNR